MANLLNVPFTSSNIDELPKDDGFGYIYMFTNTANGKKYVGRTWRIQKRISEHFNGRGYASFLCEAIKKYKKGAFEYKIMYKTNNQDKLNDVEILLIKLLSTLVPFGYNLALGGAHGKHNEETKRLIGSYHKGKIVSTETREKLRLANKGKIRSAETNEKIGKSIKAHAVAKDRPVYIFKCLDHELLHKYKNMNHLQENIDIPIKRVTGSISAGSKFKIGDVHCYALYSNVPRDVSFNFGRKVEIEDENGIVSQYMSLAEATAALNLKRGVIDSVVRGVIKQSKYKNENGTIVKFKAKYLD